MALMEVYRTFYANGSVYFAALGIALSIAYYINCFAYFVNALAAICFSVKYYCLSLLKGPTEFVMAGRRSMATPVVVDHDGRCNISNPQLHMDEACLNIVSKASDDLQLWALGSECEKCPYVNSGIVQANTTTTVIVKSTFSVSLYLSNGSHNVCDERNEVFNEYGHYRWNVSKDDCSGIYGTNVPLVPFLPLVILFNTIILLQVIYVLSKLFYHSEWLLRLRQKNVPFSELENDLGTPSPSDGPTLVRSEMMTSRKHSSRMKSLDEFRGLCIVLMIFINYGGGQYWFFKHSAWNGLTVADLVFPWFLWVMGVSMALSLRSQLRTSVSRWKIFRKVVLRSVVLVLLGVVLNTKGETSVDLGTLRLPGVLQRIGLTYFIVATIETVFMKRQVFFEYGPWLAVQDLLESWLQWLVVLLLVALHCLITFLLPVEGCPTGYLGPGGVHDHGSAPNCTGGAAGYVDRVLFTPHHLYQHPTCQPVYQTTVPYDPEGFLGTLTSVLIVYLGVHAGRIALCYHYTFSRVIRWMGWALLTGLIAGGLCDFSLSDGVIPVNKNLWSLSFVLATGSIAFMLLTILYIQIDVRNNQSIYQGLLRYAGMNAIILYVGHEITRNMFPWSWQPRFHTHAEYLLMNLWGAFLWLLVAFVLHKRNIFLSV